MKRDLRSAVARLGKDARLAAAARYRDALAGNSSDVRLYLAAAAALDGLAGARRAIAAAPHTRSEVADTAVALGRRLRSRNALLVERAAIGGVDELSLSLSGTAAVCGSVRQVSLHPLAGGSAVAVPAEVVARGESVRLVATLPAPLFAGSLARWRLAVTDGQVELPVVVAARPVLGQRWSASLPRPLRLELDAERRLVVAGRLDEPPGVAHAVSLGLTSVFVSWSGESPDLRWTARGSGLSLVVSGHRDSAGHCTATLDLLSLADRPADTWAAAVPVGGGWLQLVLPPGEYPPLGATAEVAGGGAVRLQRTDGSTVPVRVGHPSGNRLTIVVGAER